jgi:hypothetical protein
MTFISDAFGLPTPVPFLDVHVEADNPLFLDPSRIRNGTDHYSVRAHQLLVDFFTEVLRCRLSSSLVDQRRGHDLLMKLNEPNETRLGYTADGSRGHGFGPGMGSLLWDELREPVVQERALTRLEELAVVLPRVAEDLISDMSTRIIFEALVEFTQDMMRRYGGKLASSAKDCDAQIWDPAQGWTTKTVSLPHIAGRHLLLVPTEWAGPHLLMGPMPFYNRFATEAIQQEQTYYDSAGRKHAPLKRDIKDAHPDVKETNADQTVKALAKGTNLLHLFRKDANSRCVPLTPAEVQLRLRQMPMAS